MTTTPTTYVTVSRRDDTEAFTVPAHRLAEHLIADNHGATPDVIEAVKRLAEAVVTGDHTGGYEHRLGIALRVNVKDAVDIGPAQPAAPAWCEPGAKPDLENYTPKWGGHPVYHWVRDVGEAWIRGSDLCIYGRIMRGAPSILISEPASDGWTAAEARQVAAHLLNAADILDEHDGATR